MSDYELSDDDCVDGDGEIYFEHEVREYGNECHRCGAEMDD